MKILIETIPHSQQRYETVGDYKYIEDGTLHITVSEMHDDRYCSLVAIHELIEAKLTEWKGIKEQAITDFDMSFEDKREDGNIDEPGFDEKAPYLLEHTFATSVELGMCAMAGISWTAYEKVINSL